jgi:hypothetical protein
LERERIEMIAIDAEKNVAKKGAGKKVNEAKSSGRRQW